MKGTAERRFKIRSDAVTMTTAYAVEELVQQPREEGAYDILYEPFDTEELPRLVDGIWERKQGR